QNPDAIARKTIELLDTPAIRHAMRKRAYLFAREMVWKRVAQGYMDSFSRVRSDRMESPKVQFSARLTEKSLGQLPELKLNQLHRLTDDTGMLQHAIFTIPNRSEGYTTDDNARALIFSILLEQMEKDGSPQDQAANPDSSASNSAGLYLAFLEHAFNSAKGRFKDRKSTRLNSSHGSISYAVFCLKKKISKMARSPLGKFRFFTVKRMGQA